MPAASRPVVIDTCGTGGAPKCFNVSTAAAIVAAAAAPGRVWVAKHGGRSRTGRGSAEVLEKLGVNVAASPAVQARCLAEAGVCFSFAMHHHPAMKYAAGPRRSLGFPTIINMLGPLTNPAGARRQLLGTWSLDAARKLAEALGRLGCDQAMIVTSRDGMDELTTTDLNHLLIVEGTGVRGETLEASDLGLAPALPEDLRVGDLEQAASLFRAVLGGTAGPAADMVALNTAGALVVGGAAATMREGLEAARAAMRSGRAGATLRALVEFSNQP
jgi:anthranilate phosphoribosyltransferase